MTLEIAQGLPARIGLRLATAAIGKVTVATAGRTEAGALLVTDNSHWQRQLHLLDCQALEIDGITFDKRYIEIIHVEGDLSVTGNLRKLVILEHKLLPSLPGDRLKASGAEWLPFTREPAFDQVPTLVRTHRTLQVDVYG
jgi:hypothetical protein